MKRVKVALIIDDSGARAEVGSLGYARLVQAAMAGTDVLRVLGKDGEAAYVPLSIIDRPKKG